MDQRIKNLIKKIESVFDGMPKPEWVTMRIARAMDDYVSNDKYEEFRKKIDIVRLREGMNSSLKNRIEREAIYV